MNMESFEVYKYYLALRLHFTTEKYDAIKQKGRVKATKQAFFKRNDLLAMKRVADTYTDKEVVDFLVSNFVTGDRWGGVFDIEAKDRYTEWKKRIESLSYTFEKEVTKVQLFSEKAEITFNDCFIPLKGQHPYIIKMYLRGDVCIETLVILDKLLSFTTELDKKLAGDLVWPDISRIVRKYSPFLGFKKEKYEGILRGIRSI